jgi:glycosyltransferase involved in cell wall biosynthesis
MKKMKIALVATGLGMGGAENQVIALADRFAGLGHEVLLIAMTGRPVLSPSHPAVRVVILDMARKPLSVVRSYWRARRLLRDFGPDVVHSHMVHANLFCRLLRIVTPMRRLICSAHNTNEGGTVRMWAYRLTDRLADVTTNVSDEAVGCFIRRRAARPGRIMTVHNGIDIDKFQFSATDRRRLRDDADLAPGSQVLLAVGRFSEQKDYSNLLRAFAIVCRTRNDCVLWIVGTGDDQPLYAAEARRLGIAENVCFLGLRRDIPALMSAADIFVLSSAWEGLPLVIGEAMACERVIVSTDAGGIREWVGNVGYVVPTRDSASLAAALDAALRSDMAERSGRGRKGRERVVSQYSLPAVVARWLRLYQEVPDPVDQAAADVGPGIVTEP